MHSSLKRLSSSSQGRNSKALHVLRQKIDWEQAFLGMTSDGQVHPRLRRAYALFLLRAYVDVEPNFPDMEVIDLNIVSLASYRQFLRTVVACAGLSIIFEIVTFFQWRLIVYSRTHSHSLIHCMMNVSSSSSSFISLSLSRGFEELR